MALDTMFVKNSSYVFRFRSELYWSEYETLRNTAGDRKSDRRQRRTPEYVRSGRHETIQVRVRRQGTVVVGHQAECRDPPCRMPRLGQEELGS